MFRGTYFFTPPCTWFKFKRFPKGVMVPLALPAWVLIPPSESVCSSTTHSSLQTLRGLNTQVLRPPLYLSSMFQLPAYFPKFQCNGQVPQHGSQIPKATVQALYIFAMSHRSNYTTLSCFSIRNPISRFQGLGIAFNESETKFHLTISCPPRSF